ncbi:MAG: hypothetical protein RLZZ09_677 [Pseudomonadota bacterium]
MVCMRCGGAGHNNEVETVKFMLIQPEGFTRNSLDAISVAGQSDVSLGDCKAQSRTVCTIGSGQNGQVPIRRFERVCEYLLESTRRG